MAACLVHVGVHYTTDALLELVVHVRVHCITDALINAIYVYCRNGAKCPGAVAEWLRLRAEGHMPPLHGFETRHGLMPANLCLMIETKSIRIKECKKRLFD